MNIRPAPCIAAPPLAHLLIHADTAGESDGATLSSWWHRLRIPRAAGRHDHATTPLQLQVDDLQGRRLRTVANAGPLTDLPLPAGTYLITAMLGRFRRSYTMALAPGASFHLHLRVGAIAA